MLQKHPQDLNHVQEQVLKARWQSVRQLKKSMSNKIHDFDFKVGMLVLVQNSWFDKLLPDKTKSWYLGPMVVIRWMTGGSYFSGELDSSLLKLQYAAFQLILYLPHDIWSIPVTKLIGIPLKELKKITHDSGNPLDIKDDPENGIF